MTSTLQNRFQIAAAKIYIFIYIYIQTIVATNLSSPWFIWKFKKEKVANVRILCTFSVNELVLFFVNESAFLSNNGTVNGGYWFYFHAFLDEVLNEKKKGKKYIKD